MQPSMTGPGINASAPMQNVNDLVAASIHNFRMSQQFQPNVIQANGGAMYASNHMMAQQQSGGFAVANGAYGIQMQGAGGYQLPPGFVMSNDTGMVHGYVVPSNYAVSGPMQVPLQVTIRF